MNDETRNPVIKGRVKLVKKETRLLLKRGKELIVYHKVEFCPNKDLKPFMIIVREDMINNLSFILPIAVELKVVKFDNMPNDVFFEMIGWQYQDNQNFITNKLFIEQCYTLAFCLGNVVKKEHYLKWAERFKLFFDPEVHEFLKNKVKPGHLCFTRFFRLLGVLQSAGFFTCKRHIDVAKLISSDKRKAENIRKTMSSGVPHNVRKAVMNFLKN